MYPTVNPYPGPYPQGQVGPSYFDPQTNSARNQTTSPWTNYILDDANGLTNALMFQGQQEGATGQVSPTLFPPNFSIPMGPQGMPPDGTHGGGPEGVTESGHASTEEGGGFVETLKDTGIGAATGAAAGWGAAKLLPTPIKGVSAAGGAIIGGIIGFVKSLFS